MWDFGKRLLITDCERFVTFLSGLIHITLPNSTDDAWVVGGKYGLIFAEVSVIPISYLFMMLGRCLWSVELYADRQDRILRT